MRGTLMKYALQSRIQGREDGVLKGMVWGEDILDHEVDR